MFTMKRDLKKIETAEKDITTDDTSAGPRKSLRVSSSSVYASSKNSGILPAHCIFCKKQKYLKNSKSREKLLTCRQFCADQTVRKASQMRNDADIMRVTSDELIAKEAYYHGTCYRAYTVIVSKSSGTDPYENVEYNVIDQSFETVKCYLLDLYQSPDVI